MRDEDGKVPGHMKDQRKQAEKQRNRQDFGSK